MTATIPTVWSAQLQDHIISLDTSFAESLVAAAESSGHLAVLDLRSGQILWRTDGPLPANVNETPAWQKDY